MKTSRLGKIGFTGSREGMTNVQEEALHKMMGHIKPTQFHHGDCVGADADAHVVAQCVGRIKVHIHPPEDDRFRAYKEGDVFHETKPFLERNKDIVRETDLLIACPNGFSEELRSGTWSTVRYARKMGRHIMIIFPDGQIKIETGEDNKLKG